MNEEENTPAEEDAPEQEGLDESAEVDGGNDEAPHAPPAPEKTVDEQLAEMKDRFLRAQAEMENVRRRAERQVSDAAAYAVTNFAREMLSVSDNLRRALDTLPEELKQNDDLKAFVEGVDMTERELLNVFEKQGIQKIVPEGEKFDHNLHQAMFEVETNETAPGMVVQVVQPGYVIKDRLLRPAMVGVSKSGAKADDAGVDETV